MRGQFAARIGLHVLAPDLGRDAEGGATVRGGFHRLALGLRNWRHQAFAFLRLPPLCQPAIVMARIAMSRVS